MVTRPNRLNRLLPSNPLSPAKMGLLCQPVGTDANSLVPRRTQAGCDGNSHLSQADGNTRIPMFVRRGASHPLKGRSATGVQTRPLCLTAIDTDGCQKHAPGRLEFENHPCIGVDLDDINLILRCRNRFCTAWPRKKSAPRRPSTQQLQASLVSQSTARYLSGRQPAAALAVSRCGRKSPGLCCRRRSH